MIRKTRPVVAAASLFVLFACSPQAPAEAPEKVSDAEATDDEASAQSTEATKRAADEAESEPPQEPESAVRDVVSSEGTSFVFDFNASDIGQKTDERCRKEAADDMKKLAECRKRVQDRLGMPLLRFAEEEGTWYWFTYDRRGADLSMHRKIAFEFGEETPTTLTILPKGRDLGMRPKAVPASLLLTMPNPNTLEVEDSKHGKMVYRAKVGIFEAAKPISD